MRIVFAESFVDDADGIARYIERQFGASRADAFIDDLNRFCELVASRSSRTVSGAERSSASVPATRRWRRSAAGTM